MSEPKAVELAKSIVSQKKEGNYDPNSLYVFADSLEEAGDIRAPAVRNHATCCPRGYHLVANIATKGDLGMPSEINHLIKIYGPPEKWGCIGK
jgi:hypothetical protein